MAYEYAGTGRLKELKYGNVVDMSFSERDIETMQEHMKNGWVNITILKRKEPKDDITHYGRIYVPDEANDDMTDSKKEDSDFF